MEVRCTQCGAGLDVAADARLLQCPYCSTALVVDPVGVLFHEAMIPTVHEADAHAHLRRFLGGTETVAGLDREARLDPPRLEFFPFWAFTIGDEGGERAVLMPAAPSSLQGLQGIELPGGATQPMSPEVTGEAPVVAPEVPLATAREWLEGRDPGARVTRSVLYHLPMFRVDYWWRGASYHAAVDGVSGRVFAADFPAKAEAPFVLVAVLAMIVFGLEGLIIGNLLWKLVAYFFSAIPILAIAWITSRKV